MIKAFVFPGQGAQFPGMGKDLYANYSLAKEMFENLGVAQEMIALSMDEMSKNSSFSLSNILATYCFKLMGYSLVGLIISLIFFLLYPTKR